MKHWQMRRSLALILLLATMLTTVMPFAVSAEGETVGSDEATEDLYGGRTMEQILDLISGSTYDDYASKNSDKGRAPVSKRRPTILTSNDIVVEKSSTILSASELVTDSKNPNRSDYVILGSASDFDIDEMQDPESKEFLTLPEGAQFVYTPSTGKVTYKVYISKEDAGMYAIDLLYYPIVGLPQLDGDGNVLKDSNGNVIKETVSTKTTIERMFMIDGELPFNECRYLYIPRCWEYIGTDGITEILRKDQPKRSDYATDAEYQNAYDAWAIANKGGAGNFVWDKDVENNDIRPDRLEAPEWRTYFLRDWLGYTVEPFQFYLDEGWHELTFEATREPVIIGEVILYGYEEERYYEQQVINWENLGYKEIKNENAVYVIEAESPDRVSDQVLFPGTDRTSCINSPSDPADLLYNVANSSVVGQYMRYNVYVEETGLYNIMIRFRQNTMAGMFTSRRIRINGEIPFKEASYLRFNYDTRFQNQYLGYDKEIEGGNGETEFAPCLFKLEAGWNTVELEVVLGDMSEYVYRIADIISTMNSAYEEILKITGTNPDSYRDYGFDRLIPGTIADLANVAMELDEIYNELVETTGATGQHIVTLDTIRELVERMALDEYEIAPNFLTFKNYMTALSNWLYTSLSQPLKVDYLAIQGTDAEIPDSQANFFYAAWYEMRAFFASFFKDYNVIGFADEGGVEYENIINMWNTTSREDALILRTMIDSDFTPAGKVGEGIKVEIRYVAQGLQESILAGVGPDVAMMGSGTAVSWGLRHAVSNLAAVYTEEDINNKDSGKAEDWVRPGAVAGDEIFPGFNALAPKSADGGDPDATDGMTAGFLDPIFDPDTKRFYNYDANGNRITISYSPAALEAVSLRDPDDNNRVATYAIPTTMNFEMAFYRVDIFAGFADTGIGIPRTWQELHKVLPALVNQHMTMGMQTSLAGYQMLLYQMGTAMYANDYKSFNQNITAITAFDELCSLFMDYSLPISYDMTRFRTGEIPIVVANWTTYNTFMGYYELRGLWSMEPLIGWERDDNKDGVVEYVDRSSILNLDGIVIPRGPSPEHQQNVWKYIQWYTGDGAQTRLARQQLATASNTTVKYNTANLNALLQQAWTDEEFSALVEQIGHLKGIPFNPGDYNIGRYVNFAFLAVYNTKANAVDSLLTYVVDIDKELARKRKEYHLPYIIEEKTDDAQQDAPAAE